MDSAKVRQSQSIAPAPTTFHPQTITVLITSFIGSRKGQIPTHTHSHTAASTPRSQSALHLSHQPADGITQLVKVTRVLGRTGSRRRHASESRVHGYAKLAHVLPLTTILCITCHHNFYYPALENQTQITGRRASLVITHEERIFY